MKKNEIFQIESKINYNILVEEILEFARIHALIFSVEYIDFLLHFNNSKLMSDTIKINRIFENGLEQSFYLEYFFNFQDINDNYFFFYKKYPEEELIEANVLPIAKTNGRTYVCIGISEQNVGQIFLWDGDFGVTKQADNLQVFFDSLELDVV